jgi:hypothetical protein
MYLRPLSYFYSCFLLRCWYSAAKRIIQEKMLIK